MDATVNDFLSEINEIAPLQENSSDCVWEKCYDESTSYHYYWNTRTNEVTWDMPPEYKTQSKVRKKPFYVPPRTAPLFPSSSQLPKEAVKIYKIEDAESAASSERVVTKMPLETKREVKMVPSSKSLPNKTRRKSDSDDEKIVLISSYGDDSDESEIDEPVDEQKENGVEEKITKTQEVSKIPLVVGYSDSEEENDEEIPLKTYEPPVISHSTLFPTPAVIDVRDFEPPTAPVTSPRQEDDVIIKQAFQRKKRIGVSLVNSVRNKSPPAKTNDGVAENARKGLGFHGDEDKPASTYPSFAPGGVMFVKADVLNPTEVPSMDNTKQLNDSYQTLKEKLAFLSEAHGPVPPVHVMLIQLETLNTALKSGDLKPTYLQKWLDDTCSELIRLEKEATPQGWLLEWDRSHKRYYYRNATTGHNQWEYPTAQDVTGCDDAMDICTTPPPLPLNNDEAVVVAMEPPLPPQISCPSPPPPPKISDISGDKNKKNIAEIKLIKLPKEPENDEPLPPGVDPEIKTPQEPNKHDLSDVLTSFYSDLAAIEGGSPKPTEDPEPSTNVEEPPKKRKKAKVKLTQGLAMKKKGVSKLVEKWKNVQKTYND